MERKDTYNTPAQLGSQNESIENTRDWEYADGTENNYVNIKHSLKRHLSFWKNVLKPSAFVLNVVDQGYILPLKSIPPPFLGENNKSSLKQSIRGGRDKGVAEGRIGCRGTGATILL